MGNALVKTKFYTFNQNNSGGSFDYDFFKGIGQYVIVEAIDRDHAVTRAKQIGVYFDGVDQGRDCDCCGDRWYAPWDETYATEVPEVYGKGPEEMALDAYPDGHARKVFVHRMDGSILAY